MTKSPASNKTDRITDLEVQLSHQAKVIEEMSDEMHQQGLIIARLQKRLDAVIGHLSDSGEPGAAPEANVKPPHW